ncbi:MAG: hypothetical protein IKH04_08285 [Kiritimatiellae bacterium]|nr:hypothetical protein [Kiritimatiellia bacterium]
MSHYNETRHGATRLEAFGIRADVPHQIVYQFRGDEMIRAEQIAEEAM